MNPTMQKLTAGLMPIANEALKAYTVSLALIACQLDDCHVNKNVVINRK